VRQGTFKRISLSLRALVLYIGLLSVLLLHTPVVHAQDPITPPPPVADNFNDKLIAIARLFLDTLTGKSTRGSQQLFEQSRQSVRALIDNSPGDIFFLDFGNPNLPLNQFAVIAARNLLLLTPLYLLGYFLFLIYCVWRERPIPNPMLYAGLVIAVMFFLGAFAVITQGFGEIGRAIVLAFGGAGDALYPRAVLDLVLRTLIVLQERGGILAAPVLLIAAAETAIILIQLAYRGISLAIWRILSVLIIPFSILLEGIQPRTAGKLLAGFFEAWLDLVGKMTLLLMVLALATAPDLAGWIGFILPAGLLVVIFSWKFFGILSHLIEGAIARAWSSVAPTTLAADTPLPAAIEAMRAREIDAARREALKE